MFYYNDVKAPINLASAFLDESTLAKILQEEMDQEQNPPSPQHDERVLRFMPSRLILGVDGFNFTLNHLEEQMDETINPRIIIADVLDVIRLEQEALTNLEYHCLGLLEESAMGRMYHWFEPMVDYILHVGRELHRGLRDNRAYCHGVHPYHLWQLRSNGVYLQRRDLFRKEVQEELHRDGQGQRSVP